MWLKLFCGCLKLQAGVIILAFSFVQIAIIIVVSNLHDVRNFPEGTIFLICFHLLMIVTGVTLFYAAYKESKRGCLIGVGLIVVLTLLFVLGSGVSFSNKSSLTKYVCIEDYCPESLWCTPSKYHRKPEKNVTQTYELDNMDDSGMEQVQNDAEDDGSDGNDVTEDNSNSTVGGAGVGGRDPNDGDDDRPNWTGESTEGPLRNKKKSSSIDLILAIVLFIVYLLLFAYSALVVMSYYKELKTEQTED